MQRRSRQNLSRHRCFFSKAWREPVVLVPMPTIPPRPSARWYWLDGYALPVVLRAVGKAGMWKYV